MTGNIISSPHEPLFLLDESLTPAVADALNLVGYNFATVYDTFTDRGALEVWPETPILPKPSFS